MSRLRSKPSKKSRFLGLPDYSKPSNHGYFGWCIYLVKFSAAWALHIQLTYLTACCMVAEHDNKERATYTYGVVLIVRIYNGNSMRVRKCDYRKASRYRFRVKTLLHRELLESSLLKSTFLRSFRFSGAALSQILHGVKLLEDGRAKITSGYLREYLRNAIEKWLVIKPSYRPYVLTVGGPLKVPKGRGGTSAYETGAWSLWTLQPVVETDVTLIMGASMKLGPCFKSFSSQSQSVPPADALGSAHGASHGVQNTPPSTASGIPGLAFRVLLCFLLPVSLGATLSRVHGYLKAPTPNDDEAHFCAQTSIFGHVKDTLQWCEKKEKTPLQVMTCIRETDSKWGCTPTHPVTRILREAVFSRPTTAAAEPHDATITEYGILLENLRND
ncbi:hypothetical protein CIRG_03012 [Coccidioides immitis RMSCC 2394]|uniref:Uncharacterized protein n=1 Tax=Coccidioides immitis RMSCC 2394 TaxID=404692 RepID=A0A0J6Y6D4_COCIT|nr:hypothetical protein CIRG_03012 [Coccidioides immitis RMSCC 2394]